MNCHEAKRQIALHLGQEHLDAQTRKEIRAHLAACPACRSYGSRLKQTMSLLSQAELPSTSYQVRTSLWPRVKRQLEARSERRTHTLRVWLPSAISIAAACVLLIVIWPGNHNSPRSLPNHPNTGRNIVPGFPTSILPQELQPDPQYSPDDSAQQDNEALKKRKSSRFLPE